MTKKILLALSLALIAIVMESLIVDERNAAPMVILFAQNVVYVVVVECMTEDYKRMFQYQKISAIFTGTNKNYIVLCVEASWS